MSSILVLALGVLLTCTLWALLDRIDQRAAERQVELAARQAALRLEDYIGGRLLALQLVVDQVADDAAPPRDMPYHHTANRVLEHFTGFQAVNWIDEDGRLKWLVPLEGNEPAAGRLIYDHPTAGPYALQARNAGRPIGTPPLDLFQGGRGIATYLPVLGEDEDGARRHRGLVNGVFRIQALIEDCFDDTLMEEYALRLSDDGGLVFETAGFASFSRQASGRGQVAVLDRTWTLELVPRSPVWETLRHTNRLVLSLGFGVSLALALLVYLMGRQRALRRASWMERAQLQAELQRSRRLETIGRLAGGVAHDFNNLLTVVSAHAELARGHDPAIDTHLDAVEAASQRAGELTRQLLAFGGQQARPRSGVAIDPHLRDMVGLLRRLVRDDVQVEFIPGAEGVQARVPPEHLGQIILNLVVNASDAMPDGGRVEIWTQVAEGDPSEIELGVRDRGVGIHEAIRPHVFDPFFTTKGSEGTGMGLATVASLVDQAGGRIEVSSVEGGGTTFRVWLPAQRGGRTPGEASRRTTLVPPRSPGQRRVRVLLVDDDPEVLRAVEEGLQRAGLEVLSASNGRQALERLSAAGVRPDVVVSDQVMPEMGGVALARAVREAHPDLPVILFSGYADTSPADRRRLMEQGIHFVEKPVRVQELAGLCRRLVGEREGVGLARNLVP